VANDSTILREFLVAIGFKVDDKGMKKIEDGLSKTEKAASRFGIAFVAATTAVAVFVDKTSSKMEELYWSSVRLRDGAAAIQDFSLRLSKIGGTADGAKASLEGLASALRTDPAAEGVLRNLGIQTRDARGNLRGAVELVQDLAKAPMPYWLKAQWAGYFGIDEKTLFALQQDGIKTQKVYADLYKKMGISEDEATRRSAEFQNSIRDLRATFDVLGVAVAERVMPVLKGFTSWLEDVVTNREVVDRLGNIATDLIAIGTNTVKLFASLPNEALEWGAIGYFLFGKKAAVILGAIGAISGLLDKMSGDKSAVNEGRVEEAGTKGGITGYGLNRWLSDHGLSYLNTNEFNATYAEYKRRHSTAGQSLPSSGDMFTPEAGSISGASGNARAAKMVAFFEKAGWGAHQAAGIVANLIAESGLNPKKTGDNGQAYGIAQWHPDRQAAFAKWTGHDIRSSSVEEQLAFVQHEMETGVNGFTKQMLMAAQSAAQAAFIVSRYYESPAPWAENLPNRMSLANGLMQSAPLAPPQGRSSGVTLNQKTEITVNGSGDPQQTGTYVGNLQSRINGDLARNFAGAVN